MREESEPAEAEADGMESLNEAQKKQRFGPDLRLMEVLLQASLHVALQIDIIL